MQKQNKKFLVLVVIIGIVAAGSFFAWKNSNPPELEVEKVFAQIQNNKNVVQVSLYTISQFKEGKLFGGGHVRYHKDGYITGFGDLPLGAPLSINFLHTEGRSYNDCAALITQGIPLKQELFIAGLGAAGTNGLRNPATGLVGSPNEITLSSITACAYAPVQ